MTSEREATPQPGYFHEALGVFSAVAFCAYNWTFLVFFWQLPSLVLSFDADEIIAFGAYQLMFSFFECLIITLLILLIGLLLPARYFRRNPLVAGSLLTGSFLILAAYFRYLAILSAWVSAAFSTSLAAAIPFVYGSFMFLAVLLPIYAVLLARQEKVAGLVRKFVENLLVLASVYVLMSIASAGIVLVRNIR